MTLEVNLNGLTTTRKLLTSGMAGRMLGVAPATISKWCDKGRIKHFRFPDGNDRRIRVEDLLDFCKRQGMPIPVDAVTVQVCLVGVQEPLAGRLVTHLHAGGHLGTLAVATAVEAAWHLCKTVIRHLLIVDVGEVGQADAVNLARLAKTLLEVRTVALMPDDRALEPLEGHDVVLHQGVSLEELLEWSNLEGNR